MTRGEDTTAVRQETRPRTGGAKGQDRLNCLANRSPATVWSKAPHLERGWHENTDAQPGLSALLCETEARV